MTPCAGCHNRAEDDQVGEWFDSPYSQVEGGVGCADCHGLRCSGMDPSEGDRPGGRTILPARVVRAPADLTVTAICSGGVVEAEIAVSNLGAGHDLPTGSPDRRLVLEVTALGPAGHPLTPFREPGPSGTGVPPLTVPVNEFHVFPKSTGFASFRPRLPAFGTDVSRFRFAFPGGGNARVDARLLVLPVDGAGREIARASAFCISSHGDEEVGP